MRRVGVVGDGLSGLSAALSVAQRGAEAVVFAIDEPLGGRSGPISTESCEWLFDQIPLMWNRKGTLDRVLRRIKAPMPTRPILPNLIAFVREDRRISLPKTKGIFRRSTGLLAQTWPSITRSARRGHLPELDENETEAVNLLTLLSHFEPNIKDRNISVNAILDFSWHDLPRVPLDGWVGASGRMIASSRLSDVTILSGSPVTGLRINSEGRVDGVRRKGKVLPVDAVVLACPLSAKRRILKSSGLDISALPKVQLNSIYARYLGLSGCFMRPHAILWDVDREVLAIDLAQHAPERVPVKFQGSASLMHCFAYGDEGNRAARIEDFLDAQCSGWRDSIQYDLVNTKLRISDASINSKLAFDELQENGVLFAGSGIEMESRPGDHAVNTGIRAGRVASQF